MTTQVPNNMLAFDGGALGFRNRIINGAMMIDQRNAGASVTPANGDYTLDRWKVGASVASKFSVQQNSGSVTPPSGFINYLGCVSLSAYSVGSGESFFIRQQIEGLNTADLAWGTASAATVTLSFWVRSSLTGTFGGSLKNNAADRSYPFTYVISSANTWEQKSVTVAGDTSGTWLTTNGAGINVTFGIGVGATGTGTAGAWASANYNSATGATSVVGTNGATFYITGVQLEKGPTATPFEARPYGLELALAQRYYWRYVPENANEIIEVGQNETTTRSKPIIKLPVPMRVAPTVNNSGAATFNLRGSTTNVTCSSFSSAVAQGPSRIAIEANTATAHGGAAGGACLFCANTTASWFDASAEL